MSERPVIRARRQKRVMNRKARQNGLTDASFAEIGMTKNEFIEQFHVTVPLGLSELWSDLLGVPVRVC